MADVNPTIPPTTPAPSTPPTPTGGIDYTNQSSPTYIATAPNGTTPTPAQSGANSNPSPNGNSTNLATPANPAPYGYGPSGVPYGSQTSNNPNPDASVYGNNGQPITNGGPNSVNPNGLTASEQQYEDTINGFNTQVQNIINGTTPLTASEEAQVQGLQAQYQQLIDKQGMVNTNNTNTAWGRGYETGAAEYNPQFQQNIIGDIVGAGQTQIANLQTSEAMAVAQLTESLQQNDVKQISAAYDMYTSSHADVAAAIQKTVADTQQAIQDANIANVMKSGITDPADILSTLQKEGYTDISAADITAAIKNLSPDAAAIYSEAQTAAANGANADTVKLIMQAPDEATALQIATQAGVANSAILTMMQKYPDAGIMVGDTVDQANAKVQASNSYTQAQKSAALDLVAKQANIDKTFSDMAIAQANAQNANLSPDDIAAFSSTLSDYNGTKYITSTDLEGYDPKQKSVLITAAKEAGVPALTPKDSDAINSIQAAQQDLTDFNTFITTSGDGGTPILPKNWLGQPMQLADVTLNSYLQTNNQLGAYNTWKLSVIPILGALKGAGSGGGGGAARLFQTIGDLFPSDTDTVPTAEAKIAHIQTLLQNGADSIIPPKNTSTYSGVNLPGGSATSTASSFNGITLPN